MLLLLGLIIWTLVLTDCSPYHNEHEYQVCNKICMKTSICIKDVNENNKLLCNDINGRNQVKCLLFCEKNHSLNELMNSDRGMNLLYDKLYSHDIVLNDSSVQHNNNQEDKECEKICIMIAQCIKQRADIDGKSSCKETIFKVKCFPVCSEDQTTSYDEKRNLTKEDRLLSNNDFLDDDDDAIAEDRNSMMESDYNHEILTSKEIEDDINKYISTSVKQVLNRAKRTFLSMSDVADLSQAVMPYLGMESSSQSGQGQLSIQPLLQFFGQSISPPQSQDSGPPPSQDHNLPPSQGYGPPPSQDYNSPPSQGYGPPPTQGYYGPPPSQVYRPPLSFSYGSLQYPDYGYLFYLK